MSWPRTDATPSRRFTPSVAFLLAVMFALFTSPCPDNPQYASICARPRRHPTLRKCEVSFFHCAASTHRLTQDFILSILRANPSLRDTRSYLASFGPRPAKPASADRTDAHIPMPSRSQNLSTVQSIPVALEHPSPSPVLSSILNPVIKRTALVKVQGPFTDVQLDSIARGLVYLEN
jgi:hypothetical protein